MSDARKLSVDSRGRGACPGCGDAVQVEHVRSPGPVCPWCHAAVDLGSLRRRTEGIGIIGQEQLLWCGACGAVLGLTAWKR